MREEGEQAERTFVFEEVTHAGSSGEDELGDVFNDLGFVFWAEGSEPFCEALSSRLVSASLLCCGIVVLDVHPS